MKAREYCPKEYFQTTYLLITSFPSLFLADLDKAYENESETNEK